jgi:hypothetical protein
MFVLYPNCSVLRKGTNIQIVPLVNINMRTAAQRRLFRRQSVRISTELSTVFWPLFIQTENVGVAVRV